MTNDLASAPSGDRIARYELFRVPPRWLFLRVETEQGLVGWGEPVLEGYAGAVEAAVHTMMESLAGQDPGRINQHWQRLAKGHFYGGLGPVLMSALAGIDQALWDLKGKRFGVPVTDLLGGAVRDRMQMYGWVGGDEASPEASAKSARDVLAERGFTMVKMNACPRMGYIDTDGAVEAAAARLAAVREAVGPGVGIGLDFHGRCKLPMARKLIRALEPYDPAFFEEPVHPDFNDAIPDLASFTAVPIATGERMVHASQFFSLMRRPGVGILQPDLSHAGGITHVLDIARMAEHRDVALAPHCPLGPIALASCLAVDLVCVNAVFQESALGIHYHQEAGGDVVDYVTNREAFALDADGMIARLTGPGLGVEINEDAVRDAAKAGHAWRDRDWSLPDGSPTRW